MTKLVLRGVFYLLLSGIFTVLSLIFYINSETVFTVFNLALVGMAYAQAVKTLIIMNRSLE